MIHGFWPIFMFKKSLNFKQSFQIWFTMVWKIIKMQNFTSVSQYYACWSKKDCKMGTLSLVLVAGLYDYSPDKIKFVFRRTPI